MWTKFWSQLVNFDSPLHFRIYRREEIAQQRFCRVSYVVLILSTVILTNKSLGVGRLITWSTWIIIYWAKGIWGKEKQTGTWSFRNIFVIWNLKHTSRCCTIIVSMSRVHFKNKVLLSIIHTKLLHSCFSDCHSITGKTQSFWPE